ncbi:MAG: molecular chaperone Hsp33 [Alphaproteobacteria bacterium]|nr:Hsp33 family molecular chaperone HslO [Alphaproteobacteria bacterium]TAD87783.1 MAG: molecular chaperone Hsp33 [Alphaproteobacteria bacterium]
MRASAVGAGDDRLLPFQLDGRAVRGRLVRLGAAVDEIITRHAYPPSVGELLGQTLVLAALLAGALKYQGVFTLQTRSDGPVGLMVADVASDGAMRGYAQFDAEVLARADQTDAPPVPRLLGKGYLAFTVDQGPETERYQGIVSLTGATLVECIQHYFQQSEQIGTGFVLAAAEHPGGWRAAGLMIQRMPTDGGIQEPSADHADEDWQHALALLATVGEDELLDPTLAGEGLLYRLFHEDGVRAFAARSLLARCRCSADRVERMLAGLPRQDLEDLAVDGAVEVTCEFCNRAYRFPLSAS